MNFDRRCLSSWRRSGIKCQKLSWIYLTYIDSKAMGLTPSQVQVN